MHGFFGHAVRASVLPSIHPSYYDHDNLANALISLHCVLPFPVLPIKFIVQIDKATKASVSTTTSLPNSTAITRGINRSATQQIN